MPIVKVTRRLRWRWPVQSTCNLNLTLMMKFFPCMHLVRFD
ncbi:hypothetical protein YSA_08753 [Pseudomonas putida ND6]|uniref:Uncharacterized protein n=1 Tax=Pseudomonas putida ND6 TaxID=231023 RepID=I3V189_PSEPU|nr:hypothetical protein YSA_08753 [Pseudomonas putida ND6]